MTLRHYLTNNGTAMMYRSSHSSGRKGLVLSLLIFGFGLQSGLYSQDDLLLPDGGDDLLAASADQSDDLLSGEAPADGDDDLLLAPASDDDLLAPAGGGDLLLGGADSDSAEDSLLLGPAAPASDDLLALPAPRREDKDDADSVVDEAGAAHAALFAESRFPSATTCATCHPGQYEEWSVSSHAYSQMSPIFNTMHAKIVKLTNGTNGDFCIRCHTQVGMQLEEPVFMSNLERNPTSREGITCVVCHRVSKNYGKVSGRTSLEEGDIFAPVYGPSGNKILSEVLANRDKYKVNADPEKSGRSIHGEVIKFEPISTSGFCGLCHDVNLLNGFRLEEAFSQFKNTASNDRGETCQDCHMGKTPGVASGYAEGPAAVVGGVPTPSRKRTNHMFAGPDYSIVHPGIFPHNTKAQELATLAEWLQFDYQAGWGTPEFEDNAADDLEFPERWKYIEDREEARAILDEQFARLAAIREQRFQVQRRAYQLGELVVDDYGDDDLTFRINVKNGTDGHAVPTGFDAERLVYLHVRIKDREGKLVFESGDRDPNGDLRDQHSSYVHNWEMPLDGDLFTLQSKFLTRMQRGGEREQILALNYSPDPLPYIRPEARPTILTARPSAVRKHSRGLLPSGSRWAEYCVGRKETGAGGPYQLEVEMISQMVPVNLIREISDMGYDYGMSPRQVADRVVEHAHSLWHFNATIDRAGEITDWTPTEAQIMAPAPEATPPVAMEAAH